MHNCGNKKLLMPATKCRAFSYVTRPIPPKRHKQSMIIGYPRLECGLPPKRRIGPSLLLPNSPDEPKMPETMTTGIFFQSNRLLVESLLTRIEYTVQLLFEKQPVHFLDFPWGVLDPLTLLAMSNTMSQDLKMVFD